MCYHNSKGIGITTIANTVDAHGVRWEIVDDEEWVHVKLGQSKWAMLRPDTHKPISRRITTMTVEEQLARLLNEIED